MNQENREYASRIEEMVAGIEKRRELRGFYMPEDIADLAALARELERSLSNAVRGDDEAWRAWLDSLTLSQRWDLIENTAGKVGLVYEAFTAGRRSVEPPK